MQKAKTFDIEDSNIEKLGSQEDKDARLKAAKTETAWTTPNAEGGLPGKDLGMWIWRIEKFKVVAWPAEEYGKFYTGDSYILLKSIYSLDENGNPTEKLAHDIHFWIGSESSQDEYGTAAYKTVELDDFVNYSFGSDPVQHREIEASESSLFLSYFPKGISFMKGGVDTGFRHVEPTSYRTRLLHVKGKKNCVVREVECSAKSMNKGDIFILDAGLNIYEWIGSEAGIFEKQKAAEVVRALDDERGSKPEVQVYDEKTSPPGKVFWELLGGKCEIAKAVPDTMPLTKAKKMFQVSDESGSLKMTEVKFGKASLNTSDVFIVDIGSDIFVWTGKGASDSEKANGMNYATNYIKDNKRPKALPITSIVEGSYSASLNMAFQ